MPRAIRFDRYGEIDVLRVDEVPRPTPGAGQVLVQVRAAGINPGEAAIRKGLMHERFPATFPSGQGSDLAGVVAEIGPGVDTVAVGDEVIGFVDTRSSQADYVLVDAGNVTPKPAGVSWEAAGALFVAGTSAYAAVHAVDAGAGDVVVVSGAAGGVGSLAVQLARRAGATVIGLAGPANHPWLTEHGVIPVDYHHGDDTAGLDELAERVRTAAGGKVTAFIDTFGADYVDLALRLGVTPDRINTIINFAAAERHGVKTDGNAAASTSAVVAELAQLVNDGQLEVPIARTYPLDQVREAYRELEQRHTRGKIVLIP